MSLEIRMPQISSDMTEADVVGWLAAPGDAITEGDLLYEIETDKSTVEIEAPASGVLREILIPAGSNAIAVGTVLATLDVDASADREVEVSAPNASSPRESAPPVSPPASAGSAAAPPAASDRGETSEPRDEQVPPSEGVPATALARRVAERAGLDLASVSGSGPRGRITRDDVAQQLAAGAPAGPSEPSRPPRPTAGPPAGATTRPVVARGIPSEAMGRGASLTTRCRVEAAIAVLERVNAGVADDRTIGLIDLVIRASALALREIPEVNLSWDAATPNRLERIDIAIYSGADPLTSPDVIRDAAEKGLAALSTERRQSADRGDSSTAGDLEAQDAGFAIQDLGTFGLMSVSPAPPTVHGGTLGVGAALQEPVVDLGKLVAGSLLTLSLSLNPRIADPRSGARLLAAIARRLEDPLAMIL